MSIDRQALIRAAAIGTALQLSMVVVGHYVPSIAMLFGPLGVGISVVAGVLYARRAAGKAPATGGALAGGLCALLGIAVSFALGDVTAIILAFGTLSSALGGLVGGWAAARIGRSRVPAVGG